MRHAIGPVLRTFVLAACVAAAGPAPATEKLEQPPAFEPAKIPGIAASGVNYTIASPVRSDGFLRHYVLKTRHGEVAVAGDAMLQMRLHELFALEQLDTVTQSESFNKALAEAGLGPIKFTGALIANPLQTLGNTLAGAGMLMGQFGAGLVNAGKSPDDPLAGAFGVLKRKRELAAKLGVDPYTDFPPLRERLDRLSEAAAAGGLVVSGALMAIPGAAGVVISNVSTGSKVGTYARDYTAAQLLDLGRQKLLAMQVDSAVAEALVTNRSFTPVDLVALVSALEAMSGVEGRPSFAARAAKATTREAAYFMRVQAELLAAYQAKTGALSGFVTLGEFPFNRLRAGGVIGLWPVDAVAWTETTSRGLRAATEAHKRGGGGRAELWITGQATPLAKQHLKQLGWTVVENVRF